MHECYVRLFVATLLPLACSIKGVNQPVAACCSALEDVCALQMLTLMIPWTGGESEYSRCCVGGKIHPLADACTQDESFPEEGDFIDSCSIRGSSCREAIDRPLCDACVCKLSPSRRKQPAGCRTRSRQQLWHSSSTCTFRAQLSQ